MVRTACPLDCPDACSLEVTVTAGKITNVDAAPIDNTSNPLTAGWICKKVKHHADRVYSAERVLTPLIRVGAKGSGEFRQASWDEALDLVATKISESIVSHGVESVLPYLYSSSASKLEANFLMPHLFARLGCPEILHTICASTKTAAWQQVFGKMLSADAFDVAQAKLVVVWGANPAISNTHLTPLLTESRKNGGKLVVIDPRITGTAARADLHLAITPGTDVVLAYALANQLVRNGAVDHEFIKAHATGSDEFLTAASHYSLDDASRICGIPKEQIEQLAMMITTIKPALLRVGWGMERNRNGGSGIIAALALWVLAGNFGEVGSGILSSTSGGFEVDVKAKWPADLDRPNLRELNMNYVGRVLRGELVDWKVPAKVLLVQGANPAVSAVDQQGMLAGLANEDLFIIVHDQVMTDTALFADVVLPATTHFEVHDLVASYGSYSTEVIAPVIDRVGESRTNNELASALAQRLGFSLDEFNGDQVQIAELVAPQKGQPIVTRKRQTTVQFVDTWPSHNDKRARLFVANSELPLPKYVEAKQKYPLTLISPASSRTVNSMFADTDPPENSISLNPLDAQARKITSSSRVKVSNELAALEFNVIIDPALRQGVCSLPKCLWRRSSDSGITANAFAPDDLNDLAGGACFNDARVEVTVA